MDVPTAQVTDVAGDLVVDVREDDEWAEGHVPEAVHIPLHDLPDRLDELPRDRRLAVICRVGSRSAYATALLVGQGYDARNVEGGMVAWERAGLPVQG